MIKESGNKPTAIHITAERENMIFALVVKPKLNAHVKQYATTTNTRKNGANQLAGVFVVF